MYIKNRLIKIIFKLAIIFAVLECIYLFALPPVLNRIAEGNFIKSQITNNSNAAITYKNLIFKTHLKPYISLSLDNLNITDKENSYSLINTDNLYLKLSLTDLLTKKINIKTINASNLSLYLFRDTDGNFNYEKLFPSKGNNHINFVLKNNNLNINNYSLKLEDKLLNKTLTTYGEPLILEIKHKDRISIQTQGFIKNNNDKKSDFDINVTTKYPLSKKIDTNSINGKFFIYNIDLNMLMPYLKKYIDKNIKTIEGNIDYLSLSTNKTENDINQVILNSSFRNLKIDKENWQNNITANGENTFNTNFELYKNKIKVNSLAFKAKDVNIKSEGLINLNEKTPELDINVKVSDSRAENITAILPPNLVPTYKTIEKVKKYGVFGDLDADVTIKGFIPQPDIIGYVKGRNVHILDKSLHKLHNGTIDINFDKRILNMDILIDLFDNQKAKVNGYVYMFRDGINNVSVKTTDNIDFPLAQKIIIPISKVFNFQLGPIPEMDIKTGKGIIDVNIQGSIDFVNIDGYSYFHDASLFYNGLYGKVEKGIGRLDFKDDIVTFKSQQAFVKSNPLSIEGKVKINDRLDFTVSSPKAEAKDLLELINKSSLLKDVKEGMAVITDASGATRISVNMKAKIVPVAFGQPPLPPEEAFEDMKVNGSLYLLNDSCYIEGFYTPIEKLKGIVNFTETVVDLNKLEGVLGSSPINISGQIINDLNTKIPDVDITVTSNEVKLKDTIKFLTKSYLYPENYPDLSSLYKIASKHDLYFKYKAKSIDFETDKAYAVLNFINDEEDNPIKARSGKIIMDKATVKVDNINADLYDSNLLITGNVLHVDTVNPIYNLKIKTNDFNLENLNDTSKITIMPIELTNIIKQFNNYKGLADIDIFIDKNILKGNMYLKNMRFNHIKTNTPAIFDNFKVHFLDNKILINNMTAQIADMPFFGNLTVSDYYTNPNINGFITSKLTNNFINTYIDGKLAENLKVYGDIGFSSKINGTKDNITIEPKLILNPDADVIYGGINIGDVNEKREFSGKINLVKDEISIKDFEYIKYISSQNNKTYPIVFANASGKMKLNDDKQMIPLEFQIKTNKNIPARILNILLKTPVVKQGTLNCDLKYTNDLINKTSKLTGKMDCQNLDIPLFATIVKHIKLNAEKDNINMSLIGFMTDSKINITANIKNNLSEKPQINSLNIYADQIDRNKLFERFSEIHNAMNTNNKIKNLDLDGLIISNGHLEVKEMTAKSFVAKNFISDFSIDENAMFTANNMKIDVGQGNMQGKMSYNLNDTTFTGDFELNDVDSNYIAETLFEGKNQIYGNANGKLYIQTKGLTEEERIKNLSGLIFFNISDGRMPKLGSLEYLLRASNILKSGITGFTLNSVLELLNLVKTGYFSNINGNCIIENGIAKDIEIFSTGENLSLYIHGNYDISKSNAQFEILGKLSKRISTIFGKVGNTSLNTFFKLIPGISLIDFSRKDFIQDVEKIPSFTSGDYESRVFQAIVNGNINESNYVQSFKWVK